MVDKLTKLSDAIRLGATFRPQCTGAYFLDGHSCALGAAYEAVTGTNDTDGVLVSDFLRKRFGMGHCPLLINEIVNLNDGGLNREEIASWLESQGL